MIYSETPLVQLNSPLLENAGLTLLLKREDLNHPYISGNKWWKLKYNLEEAIRLGHDTLLTFGGAYSNHLYATAAAASELGMKSIGMVRGEEVLPLNATLAFCKSRGMQLQYVSRDVYRDKKDPSYIETLRSAFGNFYLIPEGGTNLLAIKGSEEWAQRLKKEIDFDHLCLPVGTGGTMAGMINVLREKQVIGFSSLKGGDFLRDEIRQWLSQPTENWRIETQYHFGGYGKLNQALTDFTIEFEKAYEIQLDPVYTAKMMYGIFDLIQHSAFQSGSRILALHTGGLQGRSGFNF